MRVYTVSFYKHINPIETEDFDGKFHSSVFMTHLSDEEIFLKDFLIIPSGYQQTFNHTLLCY